MKKAISLLMTFVLALGLIGCNGQETQNPAASDDSYAKETNRLVDLTTEFDSSENVKIVTEKETYSVNDTVIGYSITNISDVEQYIAGDDTCFCLHKLVDGKWKRVETKGEHCWNSLGLIMNPNQTEKREIQLDQYFYLPLENGEYRIAVESLISNTFEIS